MVRNRIAIVSAASLMVMMLLGGTAFAIASPLPAVPFTTVGLATSNDDREQDPVIDGNLIAWECLTGPALTDRAVFIRNLATGQTRWIGLDDGFQQSNPDVSGDRVVYEDTSSGNSNIRMYSWSSASSADVATTGNAETKPRIDGNLVVWKVTETGRLWYRDYDVAGAPTAELGAADDDAFDWDVDNGRILWSDPDFKDYRVAMVRPPLLAGQLSAFGPQPTSIQVHGDRIVCAFFATTNWNAMLYDFRPRVLSLLASTANDEWSPTVFHDTFAWCMPGSGGADMTYRRPGHLESTLGGPEQEDSPSLYGHRIVLERNNGIDSDVMLGTAALKLESRTSGADRYATAAAVSQAYYGSGPMVLSQLDNVVLCTGENFPDALAAAPLARALQGPLLLTRRDSLPPETLAEITRLAPAKIYIIGGTPTISAAVEDQLKGVYTTERIAGADRYETSAKIAEKLEDVVGPDVVHRAFFARGDNFPDALALGPIAAGAQGPILLVKTGSVPASISGAVGTLKINQGWIAGDATSVSAATATTLNSLIAVNGGGPCVRWAGPNRYDTAATIIDAGLTKRWIDLDTLGVATGTKFPDALGGGAALGYYGSPVLLTNGTSLSPAAGAFLDRHQYEIGRVDVFGGTNAVGDGVKNAIVARVK